MQRESKQTIVIELTINLCLIWLYLSIFTFFNAIFVSLDGERFVEYYKNYQGELKKYPMKKFPVQFTVDAISLTGILLFVIWTSHGGLRSEISSLFELDSGADGLRNRVGHSGDILFYYAIFAGAVTGVLAVLHWIGRFLPRLAQWLPDFSRVLVWLFELVQHLIIFLGIYVYLLHRDGAGLKRQKVLLFPFWYLVTIGLDLLGQVASSFQKTVSLSSASLYLKIVGVALMLAQIAGYKPFALI